MEIIHLMLMIDLRLHPHHRVDLLHLVAIVIAAWAAVLVVVAEAAASVVVVVVAVVVAALVAVAAAAAAAVEAIVGVILMVQDHLSAVEDKDNPQDDEILYKIK